jgi:carboxyl-terminal processing protease
MRHRRSVIIFTLLLLLSSACKRDRLPEETIVLNNWIWEGMNEVYLWEQFIPGLDPDIQPDPEEFFYRLLYEEDRNSWITDDYDALLAMFQGVELSKGMSARPGLLDDTRVISIVEYVTPNSPAASAGILRGDIIITIDGQTLDRDNYYDLYNKVTATFGFGDWNGSDVVPNGRNVELTAIELNQNPVIHSEVIHNNGHVIGYFVYTQFTSGKNNEWLAELNRVFEAFNSAGVTDVVVDLRYNGGGSLDLAAYIAATLAPLTDMQNRELFTRLVWNDFLNEYWKEADLDEDGRPDGEDSPQLVIYLPQSDLNLNLSSVYILTTGSTASASESLMTGLYPYTDVVQIGEKSYGKCYGSVTIDDWEDPKRHNWAMQPLVLKYSNAEGFTDFVEGIEPDYAIEDDLLNARPFGSLEDPLLAKAVELITGNAPLKKTVARETKFRRFPVEPKPVIERMIEWPVRPGRLQ